MDAASDDGAFDLGGGVDPDDRGAVMNGVEVVGAAPVIRRDLARGRPYDHRSRLAEVDVLPLIRILWVWTYQHACLLQLTGWRASQLLQPRPHERRFVRRDELGGAQIEEVGTILRQP